LKIELCDMMCNSINLYMNIHTHLYYDANYMHHSNNESSMVNAQKN